MIPNFRLYDLVKSPMFSDSFTEWLLTLSNIDIFKGMNLSDIGYDILIYTSEIKIYLSHKDSPKMEFCSIYRYMPKDSVHFYSFVDKDELLKSSFNELLQRLQRGSKIKSILDSNI
jgi:hypothetical protein